MSIKNYLKTKVRSLCGFYDLHDQMEAATVEIKKDVRQHLADMEARLYKNLCGEFKRDHMLHRWAVIDALEHLRFPDTEEVECPVCHYHAPQNTFKTKISECIFNGGELRRFVCPECECVFGPLKISRLSEPALAEEYKHHYSLYSEADSHISELLAFQSLEQGKKDRIYLNYGAGTWSKTSILLREQGYCVYDFEPYAGNEKHEFLISDKAELRKMRFDGIFSNDLIEHLPDPVGELAFMKELLRGGDSLMSHATGCYDYEYEYTRFHLVFLIGKSLQRVASALDMEVALTRNEASPNTNFKIATFRFKPGSPVRGKV